MKPLHRKLDRIEHRIPVDTRCPICRYPHAESSDHIVTYHDDPLDQCAECGRYLSEQGIPMHQPFKHVLLLEENRYTHNMP